ncbi:MAG: helix-turn-helix domain-containing protein [Parvularculaceae bacterium]
MPKQKPAFDRSNCPIAVTLDAIGDRWSLLVIRDLFRGAKRYNEFLNAPEGVAPNILADRLRRLEDAGLISKSAYQDNPVRHDYALTEKGRALGPVLKEIVLWANAHYPGTYKPPLTKLAQKR